MGCQKVNVERNCILIVKLIKDEDIQYHPLKNIIKDYRCLLNEINKAIIKHHIWREANQCIVLANIEEHKHDENLII